MNIRAKDLDRIMDIFTNLLPPHHEVWAYGSRVNGAAHEGSDLDLALKSTDGNLISSSLLLRLRNALRESRIPIIVELHDLAALPNSFQEVVVREGLRIFPHGDIPNISQI